MRAWAGLCGGGVAVAAREEFGGVGRWVVSFGMAGRGVGRLGGGGGRGGGDAGPLGAALG